MTFLNYASMIILCIYLKTPKGDNPFTLCMDFVALLEPSPSPIKHVDIFKGVYVNIVCGYCDEDNNFPSITWQYKRRGENKLTNVSESSIISITTLNISSKYTNSLEIKYFENKYSGIYVCKYVDSVYYEGVLIYVLEEVYDDPVPVVTGSLKKWPEYKKRYVDSINEKFENSLETPFETFATLPFSFKVVTYWGKWGECEPRKGLRGVKSRSAKCWLHCYLRKDFLKISGMLLNLTRYFCKDHYDLPCRSVTLSVKLPSISSTTRLIPYFEEIQNCNSLREPSEKRSLQQNDFIVKYLAENGHITLYCPETTIDSHVKWLKDGYFLNSSFRNNLGISEEEPHITIDTRNSLYILHASRKEEGIYVCFEDGVIKHRYKVKVVSMSRLLNQEFLRYSIYLAFVLSLTLICYCAGIIVAWHRRNSFLDPFTAIRSR